MATPSVRLLSRSLLVAVAVGSALLGTLPRAQAAPLAHWQIVSLPLVQQVGSAIYDRGRGRVVALSAEPGDASVWDWDGTQWTEWYPEAPRPDTQYGALSYDEDRRRLLLAARNSELWELDTEAGRWNRVEAMNKGPMYVWSDQRLVPAGKSGRFYLFDTYALWEWDSPTRTWTSHGDLSRSSYFVIIGVAYDDDRGRLLVMARTTNGTVLKEWDPSRGWSEKLLATFADQIALAAYDPINKGLVGFGANGQVWQWDPTAGTFSQRSSLKDAPAGASWQATTFDPVRQVFVLFAARDEVWEWSPATYHWSLVHPGHDHPGPMSFAAAVHLDDRVLVAGNGVLGRFSLLWRPDANSWTAIEPTYLPYPRWSVGLAYDAGRRVAVAFGGTSEQTSFFDEQWEIALDGAGWNNRATGGVWPAARSNPAMVYDAKRGSVLLYGGNDAEGPLSDLWEWNGTAAAWSPRPQTGLAPSGSGGLFHDGDRDVLIFVTASLEVWERPAGEGSWTTVGTSPPDAPRTPAFAFDPLRRRIVAHGGRDPATQEQRADLWEWDVDRRQWSPLAVGGAGPPPRYAQILVYEPRRESYFMYGGRSTTLQSASTKPDSLRDGWELQIYNLPDGERCTTEEAGRCASGTCNDGRCCPVGGPCGDRPSSDAAVPLPDVAVPLPDAAAPVPDVPAPDAPAPDAPEPDVAAPRADAPAPDAPAPDAAAPDAPAPDVPALDPQANQRDAAAGVSVALYTAPGCSLGGGAPPLSLPALALLVPWALRRRRRRR